MIGRRKEWIWQGWESESKRHCSREELEMPPGGTHRLYGRDRAGLAKDALPLHRGSVEVGAATESRWVAAASILRVGPRS
jgi:hypothetical protein